VYFGWIEVLKVVGAVKVTGRQIEEKDDGEFEGAGVRRVAWDRDGYLWKWISRCPL
jgi:hypothetical protein